MGQAVKTTFWKSGYSPYLVPENTLILEYFNFGSQFRHVTYQYRIILKNISKFKNCYLDITNQMAKFYSVPLSLVSSAS